MASTVDLSQIQEFEDSAEVLQTKVCKLAKMINSADHFISFTGAGLSTAANIPDYRGPNGAWTRKAQGRSAPKGTPFGAAKPTFSHMVLAGWTTTGRLTHIVSQNVDGLHRRSGVPAESISELHGNSFLEKCWKCSASFLRDAPVRQRRNAKNGGKCHECRKRAPHFCHCTQHSCDKCGAVLKDSIIHFKENLPEDDLECAFQHAELADLCVVVGSSCRVTPAADIPQRVGERGKNLVIINKQATPLDDLASLVIHGDIDTVFQMLQDELSALNSPPSASSTTAESSADPSVSAAASAVAPAADELDSPAAAACEQEQTRMQTAGEWGLLLGNTHSSDGNAHHWDLFLSSAGAGAPDLGAIVDRCEFHLHPTFQPSSVTVTQAPYRLSRKGWGTFTAFVDVYFYTSSGFAPLRLEHTLDFSKATSLGPAQAVHVQTTPLSHECSHERGLAD